MPSPYVFLSLLVLLLPNVDFSNAWIIPKDLDGIRPVDQYHDLITTPDESLQLFSKETWLTRRLEGCPICPTDEDIDPDTPLCTSLCSSKSGTCAVLPTQKRQLDSGVQNVSIELSVSGNLTGKHALAKRIISVVTQGEVSTYLQAQFSNAIGYSDADPYFGARVAELAILNDLDDTTVTASYDIPRPGPNSRPFQMGAGPLVGCTVVTIVSTRAVYMGHFWEVGAWSCGPSEFAKRCLNWFSADGIIKGLGQRFDPSKYNQPTDNTRVYIMHPRVGRTNPQTSRYRRKLPQLKQAIKDRLNNQNVPIVLYNYITIDDSPTANDPDAPLLFSSQRGKALFQFDPDARGPGINGFRIFYEQNQFQDTDPVPGPGSANGIPDMP